MACRRGVRPCGGAAGGMRSGAVVCFPATTRQHRACCSRGARRRRRGLLVGALRCCAARACNRIAAALLHGVLMVAPAPSRQSYRHSASWRSTRRTRTWRRSQTPRSSEPSSYPTTKARAGFPAAICLRRSELTRTSRVQRSCTATNTQHAHRAQRGRFFCARQSCRARRCLGTPRSSTRSRATTSCPTCVMHPCAHATASVRLLPSRVSRLRLRPCRRLRCGVLTSRRVRRSPRCSKRRCAWASRRACTSSPPRAPPPPSRWRT